METGINIMKLLLLFLLTFNIYAGTCTSISRTNNSANTVLTSTKYNADLNTSYTNQNAYDLGCGTDGTLEAAALNATEFAFLNKGIHQGCKVTYSNESTISVDKCHLSVAGNFVSTTSVNTETFGCSGCSSETTGTIYYIYAKADSTGTTLNLLFLTGAPNADGFDGSNNKVLAKIYNDATGTIDTYSIDQWKTNGFEPQNTGAVNFGTIVFGATTTAPTKGTITTDRIIWYRDGHYMVGEFVYDQADATGAAAGSGDYLFQIPTGFQMDETFMSFYTTAEGSGNFGVEGGSVLGTAIVGDDGATGNAMLGSVMAYDEKNFRLFMVNAAAGFGVIGSGFQSFTSPADPSYTGTFRVPIKGWAP
jgi:hypothetical protein